jgi:hypothetical protein
VKAIDDSYTLPFHKPTVAQKYKLVPIACFGGGLEPSLGIEQNMEVFFVP